MADLFKKIIYTGVGIVTTASERLQKNIEDINDKGDETRAEGRKIFDEILDTTEAKKEEFEGRVKDIVTNIMKSLNIPTKDEFNQLVERLGALEDAMETTPAKAKRSTAKRTTRAKSTAKRATTRAKSTAKKATTRAKKATTAAKKTTTRAKRATTSTAKKTTTRAKTTAKKATTTAKRTAKKAVTTTKATAKKATTATRKAAPKAKATVNKAASTVKNATDTKK